MAKVTPENFVRVETNRNFKIYGDMVGGTNRFYHKREFGESNASVRSNFDSLYSIGIMDLDVGDITVTLPDPKSNRWMASQVLNQDHMTHPDLLKTGPAQFTITKEMMRTRYVIVIIRTEVFDGSDPKDIKEIHRLQAGIQLSHYREGSLDGIPAWDQASYEKTRDAVQALADSWVGLNGFGALDKQKHMCITLVGALGMPTKSAVYYIREPEDRTKEYELRVKDVPCHAMWSITIYDAKGYFPSQKGHYNVMHRRLKQEPDGTYIIKFKKKSDDYNTLTIFDGWNYAIRIYNPGKTAQTQEWIFPNHTAIE